MRSTAATHVLPNQCGNPVCSVERRYKGMHANESIPIQREAQLRFCEDLFIPGSPLLKASVDVEERTLNLASGFSTFAYDVFH